MDALQKNITKLALRLKKYHVRIFFKKNFLIIDATYMITKFAEKSKKVFYLLLNLFENKYFILIKGLPYCFMPDALDHVGYAEKNNPNYRKTAKCATCKISICPGFRKNCPKSLSSQCKVYNGPQDIAIEVNQICNMKCDYCFYESTHSVSEPPFNKIIQVMDEAKEMKIKYLRFTGGEPLLRKDIIKLLRYAKSNKFYVFLNTNGTMIDKELIKELEKYVDNILVSFCSLKRDLLEQEALLNNKLRGIRILKRSKIPFLRIGIVVSKSIIDNMHNFLTLVNSLGINNVEFYRPIISRARVKSFSDFDITKQDILKLLDYMPILNNNGINAYFANPIPFCITKNQTKKIHFRGAKLDDGHCRLVFDSKGYYKPSYSIDINLGYSIRTAWSHPFIKKINSLNYLSNKCSLCKYLKWCLGGSRYLAKEYCGDYFAPDPWTIN